MKTFVASLILFSLLLTVVIYNCFFIQSVTATLTEQVNALPPCGSAGEELRALSSYWEKRRTAVELSICHEIIYEMEEKLLELAVANAENDDKSFALAKESLLLSIREIARTEQLSVNNLLCVKGRAAFYIFSFL